MRNTIWWDTHLTKIFGKSKIASDTVSFRTEIKVDFRLKHNKNTRSNPASQRMHNLAHNQTIWRTFCGSARHGPHDLCCQRQRKGAKDRVTARRSIHVACPSVYICVSALFDFRGFDSLPYKVYLGLRNCLHGGINLIKKVRYYFQGTCTAQGMYSS